MIRAIWNSFANPWGSLNEGNTPGIMSTAHFLSFIIFWIGSLPFLWFPVHKIRHLFTVKAYFVPPAGIAFMIWALVKAGGAGPIIRAPAKIQGSELAWAVILGIMSSISNFATLIVNDPDFTRFSTTQRAALYSQWITIPVGFAFTSLIGILVSSAAEVIYKEQLWNPLEVLGRFLDEGGGGQRFGVFVIAFAFTLAQLGTNIAANSVRLDLPVASYKEESLRNCSGLCRYGYDCAASTLHQHPSWLLHLRPHRSGHQSVVHGQRSIKFHDLPVLILCLPLRYRRSHHQ